MNVKITESSNTSKVLVKPTFCDPWDCQRCRDLGKLCDLHKDMTMKGFNPPQPKKGVPVQKGRTYERLLFRAA